MTWDFAHISAIALAGTMALGALASALHAKLEWQHAVVLAFAAVLAGVPTVTMSTSKDGGVSLQVGRALDAATKTTSASQAQQDAVSALNSKVNTLATALSALRAAGSAAATGSTTPPGPASAGATGSVPNAGVSTGAKTVNWPELLRQLRSDSAKVKLSSERSTRLTLQAQESLGMPSAASRTTTPGPRSNPST